MKINSTRMTVENFTDYGHFIERPEPMLEGKNDYAYTRDLADMELKTASVGYLTAYVHDSVYDSLERHKATSEMLVILSGGGTILFAKPGDDPNNGFTALEVEQGDAFVMSPSTWHGLITPMNCDTVDILVVFKKNTEDNDIDIKKLDETVEIKVR